MVTRVQLVLAVVAALVLGFFIGRLTGVDARATRPESAQPNAPGDPNRPEPIERPPRPGYPKPLDHKKVRVAPNNAERGFVPKSGGGQEG